MSGYFNSKRRRQLLQTALERWQGTPFCQGLALCQQGVDCVGLVREVYKECGIDVSPAATIPAYSLNWGQHHAHSHLLGWLLEDPKSRRAFRRLDEGTPSWPGDLWAVRLARSAHHLAILGNENPTPRLWHVPTDGVVHSVEPEALMRVGAKVVLRLRLRRSF